MEPKNFYLKSFLLTHNLNGMQVSELCSSIAHREGKRGEVVYSSGGEKQVLMVVSGNVKISEINTTGDEMIKELVGPGEIFGDIFPGYLSARYEYAEVISDRAMCYSISQDKVLDLMKSNYQFGQNYMAKLGEKFRQLEDRLVNMATKDVRTRLIYCFKDWAKKHGRIVGDKVVVRNCLTHDDIASMVSTSRQTVTVILNELKQSGKLNYNRREIEFSSMLFLA
jgi:CRP/FNR family transcriptional regulator, cyclic AMP receptor protein